jgi:hypothetical protein
MPRPPFTRFPKDRPLPASQRGELTKAFNSRMSGTGTGTASGGIREQTVVIQQSGSGITGAGITTLAGDVTGGPTSNTVSRIQGNAIAPQTIAAGQTYVLVGGVLVPSNLAGDVAGSLVANTVQGIQGVGVASVQPLDQQELVYSASANAYAPGVNPGAALYLWTNCS